MRNATSAAAGPLWLAGLGSEVRRDGVPASHWFVVRWAFGFDHRLDAVDEEIGNG
jgi:hypothetical protein